MSKKVTIPTDGGNPFVVILGGIKYVYKPGETVEVPDGVALEIEEWERWRDKYRGAVQPPFAAGGGGVQPDLSQNDPNAADYVKNRTHYEETTIVNEPLNITWDGNTDGLVSVADMLYKVSDLVLTDEQIKSASLFYVNTEMTITDDDWAGMVASGNVTEGVVNLNFLVMFVRKEGAVVQGVTIPEAGIYFVNQQGQYVSSLTTTEPVPQTKTVVKKLDKKYLPDDEPFVVNFSTADMQNWTCDKTLAEITAAKETRRTIIGNVMGEMDVDWLGFHKNGSAIFGKIIPDSTTLMSYHFVVLSEGLRATLAYVQMAEFGGAN